MSKTYDKMTVDPDTRTKLREQLEKATRSLIDPETSAYSLRPELIEMTEILSEAQRHKTYQHPDIAGGETRTPNGLAISPKMAEMCTIDFMRTIKFIRGLHDAISNLKKIITGRPIQILYAGIGPYATLAVPLMSIFSSSEANFTLIDIHPESIESARSVIETLGFEKSVQSYETTDAFDYKIDPKQSPDIILMEIMQYCLESEPQVAVARHLLYQAPDAILVPEEVNIQLILVDMSREFALNDQQQGNIKPIQRKRIPVSSVFVLNKEMIISWGTDNTDKLPATTVKMPDNINSTYKPMLFTVIKTYEDHVLKDYDSGLTCPKSLPVDREIKSGDKIKFHYKLGNYPKLIGTICT